MACEKKSFLTKEDAIKRIEEIRIEELKKGEESNHRKPIRSYRFKNCGLFHLTSWSRRLKNILLKEELKGKLNIGKKRKDGKDEKRI